MKILITSTLLFMLLFFAHCNEEEQLPPSKPELISPTNNASSQEYDLTFAWKESSDADNYSFQLSLQNDFASVELNKEDIKAPSYDVKDLKPSMIYYWRVNANNEAGTSPWSSTNTFTTKALNVPTLTSPIDNAIVPATNIKFEWNSNGEASAFRLQVSTSSDFSNIIINQTDLTVTTFNQPELVHNTNYFWRVGSIKNNVNSDWSSARKFTTEKLGVPTLISPENNLTNLARTIEFKWNTVSDADSYEFQLSTATDFSNLVAHKIELSNTLCTISGLMFSTNYYWRVRATKNNVKSDWSIVSKLTTEALGVPDLLSPDNNAQLTNTTVEFKWGAINEATSYNLQVSITNDFSSLSVNKNGLTSLTFTSSSLKSNTKYYWRVNAQVENCQSEWSAIRSFNTPALPTTGLVAWYPFNGNANDESGNGNHGIINGGVTSTSDRYNIGGKAYAFDGTSGYIEISKLNNLAYKPISYSAWVIVDSYFPLSPGIKFRSIIGRQEFFNTTCGMVGFYADQNVAGGAYDNTFLYWMGDTSTPDVPNSKIKPSLNNWVHVVFTQDTNGNFKFYLNGSLTNSGIINNVQNSNISFRIGAGIGANSYFWNNKIDDVRIYNRVLSVTEVSALFNE